MATIKDVAKLAGVHPSTVSRVIDNNPRITTATKDKVLAAMKELKYKPNAIARSLANQSKTKIVGVIFANDNERLFHNPFFTRVTSSISAYAQDHGYFIMHGHSREEEKEINILKKLVNSRWVDGVILTTVRKSDKCVAYLNEVNMPYVVIGTAENTHGKYTVDNDNMVAMYSATKRMIQKGYERICFIGGSLEFTVNEDRCEGYKRAMDDANLHYDDSMMYFKDDSEQCGEQGMEKFLEKIVPEAVVTTDDLIAYGACQRGHDKFGEYIPVIGFNNTPVSMYRNPAFSSVDIFSDKLGKCAAKLLIDQLEDNEIASSHQIVKTELVIRE